MAVNLIPQVSQPRGALLSDEKPPEKCNWSQSVHCCQAGNVIFCRSFRQRGLQEVVAVTFVLTGLCRVGTLAVMSKVTLNTFLFFFPHSGKGRFRNSAPTLRCCWLDANQTCAPTWARWWSFPTTDRRPSPTTRYADQMWICKSTFAHLWTQKSPLSLLTPLPKLTTVFDLPPWSFRAPAWPSRSRRPTSSARLSSRRTVSETFSTWPRLHASTRTTKMSNAAKPPVAPRGFHTCPAGPTWRPWPRTSERTKPKAARLCDWSGEGWGQSTVQAGSYGAALIPACLRPPIFLERGFISFTWCSCYWNTLHQHWKINA